MPWLATNMSAANAGVDLVILAMAVRGMVSGVLARCKGHQRYFNQLESILAPVWLSDLRIRKKEPD